MRKVLSLVACCLVLSGCATVGDVRVEGAAAQVTPPPSTPPPPSGATPSMDPVAVLRADPKVSAGIKSLLVPCIQDRYPVDARYSDVTQDDVPELIVTVVSCDSKLPAGLDYHFNLGVYVYNTKTAPLTDLLSVEEPGVDITPEPDFGLIVSHLRYKARDKSCCPSDSLDVPYKWNGTAFEQLKK
jgi:predicted small secreted protein